MITLTLDEWISINKSNPTIEIIDCFEIVTVLHRDGTEATRIGRASKILEHRADFN